MSEYVSCFVSPSMSFILTIKGSTKPIKKFRLHLKRHKQMPTSNTKISQKLPTKRYANLTILLPIPVFICCAIISANVIKYIIPLFRDDSIIPDSARGLGVFFIYLPVIIPPIVSIAFSVASYKHVERAIGRASIGVVISFVPMYLLYYMLTTTNLGF